MGRKNTVRDGLSGGKKPRNALELPVDKGGVLADHDPKGRDGEVGDVSRGSSQARSGHDGSDVEAGRTISFGANAINRLRSTEVGARASVSNAMRRGGYELIELIGKGGMAQVWRARHDGPGGATKGVAVKLMLPHLTSDPAYREMFLREARLAMQLNSPNIVQVFAAGEEDGELYLVMEWVQGQNLSTIMRMLWSRGEPFPLDLAAYVIGELLSALDHAHHVYAEGQATGIIHRDVTPQNVLVSKEGAVKLTDFGVARASGDMSTTGAKGKLRYMAREHLMGKPSQASDLFGVGAIFYELLAGHRFRHQAEDEAQLYRFIMEETSVVPPVPLPEPLAFLLQGLLDPKTERRIQSAERALELLERWPGYRPGRTGLKKLYESLFGPQSTRTGFTRMIPAEAIEELAAQAQAHAAAQAAVPIVPTVPLGDDVPQPRTATAALWEPSPPSSGATGTAHLQTPEEIPTRTASPSSSQSIPMSAATLAEPVSEPRKVQWWWLAALPALAIAGFVIAMPFVTPSQADEGEAVHPTQPTEVAAREVAQPTDAPAGSVRDDASEGPVIPPPEARLGAPDDEASAAGTHDGAQPAEGAEVSDGGATALDDDAAPPEEVGTRSEPEAPPPASTKPDPTKSASKPKSTSGSKSATDAPELMVHLRLSNVPAAYVKIDGAVHVVDPAKTVRLVAGKHKFAWRATKNDPWSKSRTFDIGAGGEEWVVMIAPTGLTAMTFSQWRARGK